MAIAKQAPAVDERRNHGSHFTLPRRRAGIELRVQEDEIADARWFGPGDALCDIPMVESIAGRLVRTNLPLDVAGRASV